MPVVLALCGILFLGLAALSAREKARQRDREVALIRGRELPEPRETPVSQGLVDLVAVAGGIYLSLIMVAGFIGYELPGRVEILGGLIDPIAVMSILLAVIEPFLSRLFERV
jgi:Ni,Fe-hydrogenase III small subunit